MSVTDLFCLFLLTGIAQAIARCRSSFFENEGMCQPCPKNCQACTSLTNCIGCWDTFYGPSCNLKCSQCRDKCQQKYGHCTFGCPDGTFALAAARTCTDCIPYCEVCSTASDCIRCVAGRFGPACQRPCIDACVNDRCNVTTGMCPGCEEGHVSEGGVCKRCSEGCARCLDVDICTKCRDDFYGPYKGTCIAQCPTTKRNRQFWATSGDRCGNPKGDITHNTPTCEIIPSGRSYTCSTTTYCVSYVECSSDRRCTQGHGNDTVDADDNADPDELKNGVCATVMSEKCLAKCMAHTPLKSDFPLEDDVKHQCTESCAVELPEEAGTFSTLCFHGNTQITGNGSADGVAALLKTIVSCFPDVETVKHSGTRPGQWTVIVIIAAGSAGFMCIGVTLLICCYKSRKSRSTAKNPSVPTTLQPGEAAATPGTTEGNPPPRNQPNRRSNECLAEAGMTPLRNMDTLHREEHVRTDASARMVAAWKQPSETGAEYLALGIDNGEQLYESINTQDSYVECETTRHIPETYGNTRTDTEKEDESEYLTPVHTVNIYTELF